MDSRINSTETHMGFDLIMNDMGFGLLIIILTLITISIFCAIYQISYGEDEYPAIESSNEQRMVTIHNTQSNNSNIPNNHA